MSTSYVNKRRNIKIRLTNIVLPVLLSLYLDYSENEAARESLLIKRRNG